jgi:hypothetical protein
MLPKNSVFHKQDWFTIEKYAGEFEQKDFSFLSLYSERFFNERPFLAHSCYVMLTLKANGRKAASCRCSGLFGGSIVPSDALSPLRTQEFLETAGQFVRILGDSGFISFKRLTAGDLVGDERHAGLLERYCSLQGDSDVPVIKDIHFRRLLPDPAGNTGGLLKYLRSW